MSGGALAPRVPRARGAVIVLVSRRSRRWLPPAVLIAITLVAPSAQASWLPSGEGRSFARAQQIEAGKVPTTTKTNRSVELTWTASKLAGGGDVTDYLVRRYDAAGGTVQTIGNNCAGGIAVLTCTEEAVPPGDWYYTVTPRLAQWNGPESLPSTTVTIEAPALSLTSPTTLTSLEGDLSGNLRHFVAGQSITFRLDHPAAGTVLTGNASPATIPSDGSASMSVKIPRGTTNGPHTVYAIGNAGDVASAVFNVNVTPPQPTTLALTNGGGGGGGSSGRIATGDWLDITYSQALDVASLCSTWSGNAGNQSVNSDDVVSVTIVSDGAASGNDQLVVATSAAACGGAFAFGSVDLGSPSFVSGDVVFQGSGINRSTIAWDASAFKLTITLGAKLSGPNPGRVNSNVTATYTPAPGIRNLSWTPITGTATTTAIVF